MTQKKIQTTHRQYALVSGDGYHRIVASWSAGCWVNEYTNSLVQHRRRRGGAEHKVQILRTEGLLQGVERDTAQLGLD
jgi:hypothetical protein